MKRSIFLLILLLPVIYCDMMMMMSDTSSMDAIYPLYDALIVLSMDSIIMPNTGFAMIDPVMDTNLLFMETFNFVMEYYGINISKPSPDYTVMKMSVNDSVTRYSVLAMAVKGKDGQPLYKIPITNVFVRDDFYDVTILRPMIVHGIYGGVAGKRLVPNSSILYGKYRFFSKCPTSGQLVQIFDPITFLGICPMTPTDFEGMGNPDLSTATYAFVCQLEHPVWGTGMARGQTSMMMMMDDPNSSMRMFNSINVMQFPGSIMERMASPMLTETRDVVLGAAMCNMDDPCM